MLLRRTVSAKAKPIAFILAGHNGSGKSTLWSERLSPQLKIPLINADRLTSSILPTPDPKTSRLPRWAQELRDRDTRWQSLSQAGVQAFVSLVMEQQMPFALETVFSHWKELPGGGHESKLDTIIALQKAGYFVVLLFVGLASEQLSILRVQTRIEQGGHAVPLAKLKARFPRTQKAIGHAAPIADMTLMFDNSRTFDKAFALVRVQQKARVLFDCRDSRYAVERSFRKVARQWLDMVIDLSPLRRVSRPSVS
jgi:predicted ABC-type ATPase